jgi:D-lactate dehydrogenase (cytochrome)
LVDDTIVADDDAGLARLHAIRHALPAAVNEIIARTGVRKVGTDFAVPDAALPEMLDRYDDTGMPAVCFGHIGDNHLHLNFLPTTPAEWKDAKDRYMALARRAVELGGTVSAEHGIGRLKRAHLEMMVGSAQVEAWRAMRRLADPRAILGRGVMV